MCMKHEDKYKGCADWVGIAYPIHENSDGEYLIPSIEDLMGAEIDREKAEQEFLDLLDSWHERGIMKPKELEK